MPDEQLDYLAERFLTLELQTLLRITFAQYLADPEGADRNAYILMAGGGLCTFYNPPRPVFH